MNIRISGSECFFESNEILYSTVNTQSMWYFTYNWHHNLQYTFSIEWLLCSCRLSSHSSQERLKTLSTWISAWKVTSVLDCRMVPKVLGRLRKVWQTYKNALVKRLFTHIKIERTELGRPWGLYLENCLLTRIDMNTLPSFGERNSLFKSVREF